MISKELGDKSEAQQALAKLLKRKFLNKESLETKVKQHKLLQNYKLKKS
jgi:hypothetical protein